MENSAQQTLDTKLADAAENGKLSDVMDLLKSGANINGVHCLDGCRHTPLMMAAIKGHMNVLVFLLEQGADTGMMGSENKTAAELAKDNGKIECMTRITAAEEERQPDRVSFYSPLGDRTRHDIYDFDAKERVTLIRAGKYGAAEAAVIKSFAEIEDQSDTSMLRKAFNEHVKRGGTIEESEVFTRNVFKPKPALQKAP